MGKANTGFYQVIKQWLSWTKAEVILTLIGVVIAIISYIVLISPKHNPEGSETIILKEDVEKYIFNLKKNINIGNIM